MGLHAPTVHFHLGALLLTTLAASIAVLLSLLSKTRLLKDERLSPERKMKILGHLDFTAAAAGVVGILGIFAAMVAGLMDASGYSIEDKLTNPFDAISEGMDKTQDNDVLSFKAIWGIIGTVCFLLLLVMRYYYGKIKHESFYDQHFAIQALYAELSILGYFILAIVGATGGVFAKGETVLQEWTITSGFLPDAVPGGGSYLLFTTIFAVIIGAILVGIAFMQQRSSS
ncbi:MAG: hypothetical protein ACXAEI_02150 [Candidatus Hodarchaeales archaeon]|jgi:hypothetical protein